MCGSFQIGGSLLSFKVAMQASFSVDCFNYWHADLPSFPGLSQGRQTLDFSLATDTLTVLHHKLTSCTGTMSTQSCFIKSYYKAPCLTWLLLGNLLQWSQRLFTVYIQMALNILKSSWYWSYRIKHQRRWKEMYTDDLFITTVLLFSALCCHPSCINSVLKMRNH